MKELTQSQSKSTQSGRPDQPMNGMISKRCLCLDGRTTVSVSFTHDVMILDVILPPDNPRMEQPAPGSSGSQVPGLFQVQARCPPVTRQTLLNINVFKYKYIGKHFKYLFKYFSNTFNFQDVLLCR